MKKIKVKSDSTESNVDFATSMSVRNSTRKRIKKLAAELEVDMIDLVDIWSEQAEKEYNK